MHITPVQTKNQSPAITFSGNGFGNRKAAWIGSLLIGASVLLPLATRGNAQGDRFEKPGTVHKDPVKPSPPPLSDKDLAALNALRYNADPKQDFHALEAVWAKKTNPVIIQAITELYEVEQADLKAYKAGSLAAKDMRVRLALANFVAPGKIGDDDDVGPSVHFTRVYDKPAPGGKVYRIQVNERWPVIQKTGGLGAPDVIRALVQVKPTDPTDKKSFRTVLSGLYHVEWDVNADGAYGNARLFPLFNNQHYYNAERDEKTGENLVNPTFMELSNPQSCLICHSGSNSNTKRLFGVPQTDYRSIVPREEYDKPLNRQRGYRLYKKHLEQRLAGMDPGPKQEKFRQFVNTTLKLLEDPVNLRVPYIIPALKLTKHSSIPMLGGDRELEKWRFDDTSYERDGKKYRKAGADHHNPIGFGDWWGLSDLQIIPGGPQIYGVEDR